MLASKSTPKVFWYPCGWVNESRVLRECGWGQWVLWVGSLSLVSEGNVDGSTSLVCKGIVGGPKRVSYIKRSWVGQWQSPIIVYLILLQLYGCFLHKTGLQNNTMTCCGYDLSPRIVSFFTHYQWVGREICRHAGRSGIQLWAVLAHFMITLNLLVSYWSLKSLMFATDLPMTKVKKWQNHTSLILFAERLFN